MIHPNGAESKSTITRIAGTATGGKRQGREVPQLLRVQPGAKHLVWKTQSKKSTLLQNRLHSFINKENVSFNSTD
jgi:hypothetical protein